MVGQSAVMNIHPPFCLALMSTLNRNNDRLQVLSLAYSRISDSGVVALAYALSANRSLSELNLEGNQIFDDGVLALADALKSNRYPAFTPACAV